MKIRITESLPGELHQKGPEIMRVLGRLCGCNQHIEKAEAVPDDQIWQTPTAFEYPVLAQSVDANRSFVDRIKKLMDEKIAKVLEG